MAIDSVSRNSSVALVTIHLRDINDHRPTFPESHYNLSIFEHSPVGSVVTDSIHVSDGGQGWARLGDMEGGPGTVALPKSPYHLMPLGLSKRACMCEYVWGCVVWGCLV